MQKLMNKDFFYVVPKREVIWDFRVKQTNKRLTFREFGKTFTFPIRFTQLIWSPKIYAYIPVVEF